jgi:hypothetical protein
MRTTVGTNIKLTRSPSQGNSTISSKIGIPIMDNYVRIGNYQNEGSSSMTKTVNITNSGINGDYIEIICMQMGNTGTALVQPGWAELYINKIASTTIP